MGAIPKGWNVICEDESIFIYDSYIRYVWAPKGNKPRVKITGSHKMTFVFGSLSIDGRRMFRQYPKMNSDIFIKYLKCLKRKFKKIIFFYDGAPWHRSEDVEDFVEENKNWIIPVRLPKYSPEFNPLEECWRQGKNDITGSILPPSFDNLKHNISEYYRTKRFNLDLVKYLCQ